MSKQHLLDEVASKDIPADVKARALAAIERIASTGEACFNEMNGDSIFNAFNWKLTKEDYTFWLNVQRAPTLEVSPTLPAKDETVAHSPTPWSYDYHPYRFGEGFEYFESLTIRAGARNVAVIDWGKSGLIEGDGANAAFIVNAANSHQALVDACTAALNFHSRCDETCDDGDPVCALSSKLRFALKQATGEGGKANA